jgi:ribose transport system substrate-binding protein
MMLSPHTSLPGALRRPRRNPRALALLLASAAALILAACSSSGGGSASSSSGQSASSGASTAAVQAALASEMKAPTTITQTSPLSSAPPTGKTIIFLGTSNPTNVQLQQVTAALAKLVGWSYSEISYNPADPGTLQAAFASALVKHPTFVTEAGIPPSLFGSSTVKSYQNAGVPIIVQAATPVALSKWILGVPAGPSGEVVGGRSLADWFIVNSGGHGTALLTNVPGYPVLVPYVTSFQAETKKYCPACTVKVVNLSLTQVAAGQSVSAITSALQRDPSIHYLFADDGDFVNGITSSLAAAGLSKVVVGGYAPTTDSLAALRGGTETVWAAYSAYTTMDIAFRWLENEPYQQLLTDEQVDSSSPAQLLTKANVGNTTLWNLPGNQLEQFEKLWKIPVTACTVGCES